MYITYIFIMIFITVVTTSDWAITKKSTGKAI